VYFRAVTTKDTLQDFAGKHHWRAGNGQGGEGSNRFGSDGEDLYIEVPAGTVLHDEDLDLMIKDLDTPGVCVKVCKGGRGGKGNKMYASSTNQTPRYAEQGKPGQERNLRLELKLIADVGLVGMPNAGKSTLISRCSHARPKVANYPFTTLEPMLGIVELSGYRRFVMADIPGLIEGAHDGAGLGHDFLRHIERTRILLHLLDVDPADKSDPVENYHTIRRELEMHSEQLCNKSELVVINKMDLDPDGILAEDISRRLGKKVCGRISGVSGEGIAELNEYLWTQIRQEKDESDRD
jgi:GTP-binding protein